MVVDTFIYMDSPWVYVDCKMHDIDECIQVFPNLFCSKHGQPFLVLNPSSRYNKNNISVFNIFLSIHYWKVEYFISQIHSFPLQSRIICPNHYSNFLPSDFTIKITFFINHLSFCHYHWKSVQNFHICYFQILANFSTLFRCFCIIFSW